MFNCRIIQSFTFAVLLLASTQVSAFPDMRNYPHDVEKGKTTTFYSSDEFQGLQILKEEIDGQELDGYAGTCRVTGIDVAIDTPMKRCLLWDKIGKSPDQPEVSDLRYFLTSDETGKFDAYPFEKGFLLVRSSFENSEVVFFKWVSYG